jgi:hypothetical protein
MTGPRQQDAQTPITLTYYKQTQTPVVRLVLWYSQDMFGG